MICPGISRPLWRPVCEAIAVKQIIGLAARGDGVADDGSFHALTAPGDTIRDDGSILRGPHHRDPCCPHFGTCGGCQLQHVDDVAYADFLRSRIRSALAAQGIAFDAFAEAHVSPPGTRRRASLTAERKGRQVFLGFNEGSSHKIADLRSCPVLDPALETLIPALRRLLGRIMPERARGHVHVTRTDQGTDVLLSGFEVAGLAAAEALTDFAGNERLARLSVDEGLGPAARWEPAPVTVTMGSVPVGFPEGAFLQATPQGEAALVAAVRDAVKSHTSVVDLFSGLGTFALAIEGVVHAIEGARDLVLALQAAARRAGTALSCEHRDLFRRPLSPDELGRFDAVIIDPPRAGAREQVEQLARSKVRRIAYVSCNPSTFARDAKLLTESGYQLTAITPVGQFRWSTHVELAATFLR